MTKAITSMSFEELRSQLEYDDRSPLGVEELSVWDEDGITIRDIRFRGHARSAIPAYLVTSDRPIRGPGVLCVHPGPGDRSFFLEDARRLAGRGIASLLVEMPWAEGERWGRTMGQPDHDLQEFLNAAKDLRRSIDVLLTIPEVDNLRLGYLGLSYGAMFGGLLAGTEDRLSHYALLSGLGSFTDVAAYNVPELKGARLEEYREKLSSIDPARFVSHAAPASLLLIFGTEDKFPQEALVSFADAGSEPKEVKVVEAGHLLNDDAHHYAMDWLVHSLSFKQIETTMREKA